VSDEGSKKWRCAWCDKPHERNDPPCDNCGHHKFERAVVPVAPDNPDHEPDPIWVCPECGREHQKNSPPCSRCGNPSLEKTTPDYSDLDDLGAPSYVDLLEPRYVALAVVAVLAGGLLVLGVIGIGPLAGLVGEDLAVSNVPGNATTASGLSLATVEEGYVAALNERRVDRDAGNLSRTDRADDIAQYLNQRRVKRAFSDGSVPELDRVRGPLENTCGDGWTIEPLVVGTPGTNTLASYDDATAAGRELFENASGENALAEGTVVGLDIHVAPDGRVYLTRLIC
jgi:hypothetical protein